MPTSGSRSRFGHTPGPTRRRSRRRGAVAHPAVLRLDRAAERVVRGDSDPFAAERLERTSIVPSPPSASGQRSACAPAASRPAAIASATSREEYVPLKESGATSTHAPVRGGPPRNLPSPTMPPLLRAMRPQEWIKNVFVFAGLLFSGKFDGSARGRRGDPHLRRLLRDLQRRLLRQRPDRRRADRKHPKKRFRPLAAGELSEGAANAIAPVLAAFAIALAFATVNWEVGLMVVGYGIAQVAYSLGLKQIVIVDVMTSRRPLHPARRRRRQRRRRPRLRMAARSAPACSPSSSASPSAARRRSPSCTRGPAAARPRALLAALPRPDGLPGHHRHRDQLRDLHRQLAARSAAR